MDPGTSTERTWGPWRLDTETYVLYPVEPYRYEIDLEECLTSAQMLDWIIQISEKNWADDATIAGLVRAMDDVLHPQATLCSFGQSKRLTTTQVRQHVRSLASRQRHERSALRAGFKP